MEGEILDDIKENYSCLNASHVNQWSRTRHLMNVITQLELEERIPCSQRERENDTVRIAYSSLFNWHDTDKKLDRKVLLVEGEAGIGKTVLCTLIAKDWESGEHFQEFVLVLLLPLYQRNVTTASSLPKLLSNLYNMNEEKCHCVASFLKRNYESNVLIIADGWDEFLHHKESFLHDLLFGNLLPSSSVTVMITSRPASVPWHIQNFISRSVTVRGFNIETVESCMRSEFSCNRKKIKYLLKQLEDNPLVESMCRVPLNLAMICSLCCSSSDPLPDTITDMYGKICWNLAEMSIKSIDEYKYMSLSSYHDLPKELQQSWWLLCELAFRNIEKNLSDYCTFSLVEVTSFSSFELEMRFGFLKPMSKTGDNFLFLHPTFEEYLAALHLARQPRVIQLEFIKHCAKQINQKLTYFWQFFIGIYTREAVNVNADIIVQVFDMLSKLHYSGSDEYLLCHYSFEAKNKTVTQEVVKALNNCTKNSVPSDDKTLHFGHGRNAYDCIAMIYVIDNTEKQCSVEINFQKCNLNVSHIPKLENALGNGSHTKIQVKGLDLSYNILKDSDVANLFRKATVSLQSLEKLSLCNCNVKQKSIGAILDALAKSSSKCLTHLDLSLNPISKSCLRILQQQIHRGTLVNLEIFLLRGSLTKDVSLSILAKFIDELSAQCQRLRKMDLSDNYLGKPNNQALSKIISKLTGGTESFVLHLNDEYMAEVDEKFFSALQESMKKKGTINRTVAHGIIVGPGRSGKNTLMNRLMGIGSPDSSFKSPSTGVLENVVMVEVKKLCTVATAVKNLEWKRLEYDEEALELMMTTAKYYSAMSNPMDVKFIVQDRPLRFKGDVVHSTCKSSPLSSANPSTDLGRSNKGDNLSVGPKTSKAAGSTSLTHHDMEMSNRNVAVYSSDVEPVDIFKRAVKLRSMDGLREQLESSWSLYLTNTGGQIEFQEYLPLLVCGPSVFFVTFPLHYDLNEPYIVKYQPSDGEENKYKSPATLLEELLQILATINALDYNHSDADIKPKVYFVGTHRDYLPESEAEDIILEIDKQIQECVRQTSLFHQGSIQFAQSSQQMIFTVNNLSNDDNDFRKIRSSVQQTVERKCNKEFTVKCPSSWLVFSLILRAKHKSNQVLSFDECFTIAQDCGISQYRELKEALLFIHSRLGLVRYFDVDDLRTYVVIDPQILFDKITHLLVKTFISDNAEQNDIEAFKKRGIFSVEFVKRISESGSFNSKLPFTWLTKLLNYLRIAALFKDKKGEKYFFPSALCHAPEPHSNQVSNLDAPPSALIVFESGFCPRGISGALIKCLMTNEMKSERLWELLPHKIHRNQVTFHIMACGNITLKILPTHLEICLDSESDISETESKVTCEEAFIQINSSMKIVTSQHMKCKYFWTFYCTQSTCKAHPHPAEIEWDGNNPLKLKCKVSNPYRWRDLPKGYEIWSIKRRPRQGVPHLQLDKEIDPKHLGKIADSMAEWEGRIADDLELTDVDVSSIKTKHPTNLRLQSKEALSVWKRKHGSRATYCRLISVFEHAGYQSYADNVKRIIYVSEDEANNSSSDELNFPLPQPRTYPLHEPLCPQRSPQLPSSEVSSWEEYMHINSETGKYLPKDVVDTHDILDSDSYNVLMLPMLSSRIVDKMLLEPASDKLKDEHFESDQGYGLPQLSEELRFEQDGQSVLLTNPSEIESGCLSLATPPIQKHDIMKPGVIGRYSIQDPYAVAVGNGLRKAEFGVISKVILLLTRVLVPVVSGDLLPDSKAASIVKCTVNELEPYRKYEISYVPTTRGWHKLHIRVNNEHVDGSPFNVIVTPPVEMLGSPVLIINGLSQPTCVKVNQQGEILVVEKGRQCVSVFSRDGVNVCSFGSPELLGPHILMVPCGIAITDGGNVLVVDSGNHHISEFTSEGKYIRSVGTYGSGALQFNEPVGIGIHPINKSIYVTESDRIQILSHDMESSISIIQSNSSDYGQLNKPLDVSFDGSGAVYIADSGNHRILVFRYYDGDESLKFFKALGSEKQLQWPSRVFVDSENRVCVTEEGNHCVSVFTYLGKFLKTFGKKGTALGEFDKPQGITVDTSGYIYVCDHMNNRLQVF